MAPGDRRTDPPPQREDIRGWGWNIVSIGTDLADKRSVRLCADLRRNASHPGGWRGSESDVVLVEGHEPKGPELNICVFRIYLCQRMSASASLVSVVARWSRCSRAVEAMFRPT